MATPLQEQRKRERELAQAQQTIEKYFPGGTLQAPKGSAPTPQPQFPVVDIPRGPALPSIGIPKLTAPQMPNLGAIAGMFSGGGEQAAAQAKLARDEAALAKARATADNAALDAGARLRAVKQVEALEQMISANPINRGQAAATRQAANASAKLQEAGFAPVGGKPVPTTAPQITFGVQTTPPPAPQAAVNNAGPATPDDYLLAAFPGAKITSGTRDPSKNAAVGGAPNSMHLTGEARDIVLPKGADRGAAVKALKAQGFTEVLDEGDHIHVGWRGAAATPFQQVMPTLAPGDRTNSPGVSVADPSILAGMIPTPRLRPQINLPDAPQEAMPADLPQMQGIDPAWMDELRTASAPVPLDTSGNPWDRIQAMLSAAAGSAAGASPEAGLGGMIAAAGGAAGGAFKNEKDKQKAEQKQYDEQVRQVNMMLAEQGFDIKVSNLDTKNKNLTIQWQSGENKRTTAARNAERMDARSVQEILAQNGILADNIGALNQTDLARANVMIQGTQNLASATNSANQNQQQLNVAGGTSEAAVEQLMQASGIDTKNTKNPLLGTARGTAAAIVANNPQLALQSFAQELVLNGGALEILAPDKGDTPDAAAAKAKAVQALKRAKKPEEAGAAVQVLAQLFAGDQAVAYQIAQEFAKRGYPSAQLITAKGQLK